MVKQKYILKFDHFWLSEFNNGLGTKNRFQPLWIYKIFKHRKHPFITCLGKRIFICNNELFLLCFFPFIPFAKQLFSTQVTSSNLRNQALLFMEFGLLHLQVIILWGES